MSFPKFGNEFNDWNQVGKFILITKTLVDYEVSESGDKIRFSGIFYPMKNQQISLKPEGQRAWRWWSLITSQPLAMDDIVEYSNVQYRVFSKADWSFIAGKYTYDLAEAFHESN